jgi:uncharacterized protein (TIGR02145 family)
MDSGGKSAATANNTETETAAPQGGTSAGTKIKYVAVVETDIDAQSGASAQLNPAEVRQVTAVLRKEAVKNLPQGRYNIMTSETVLAQGGAVLEECADENCVITLGSRIGADYIVRGTVSKFGTMLTVSVDIYETNDGNLVASSELVRSENIVELLDGTAGACAEMYMKFVNKQDSKQNFTPPMPSYQQYSEDGSSTLIDNRDGKTYKTVVIGGKRWMAENLNYQPQSGKSWCYKKKDSNCGKYGRLYDWKTAMTVCPSGYHLPSSKEWDNLVTTVGGNWTAGKKLKASDGWNKKGNGTNASGFSAMPGGQRDIFGIFWLAGYTGYWWTATKFVRIYAHYRGMYHDYDYVDEPYTTKGAGLSVRCVADD